MDKKFLIKIIDDIFVPLGFKRKGNSWWVLNSLELSKLINLQKSNYNNIYYLNYGYIIKGLELNTTMHIFNRLGSIDKNENKRITDLLNLEGGIGIEERTVDLKKILNAKIALEINNINTEQDLLNYLKSRENLNNIPLVVKKHFNLFQ